MLYQLILIQIITFVFLVIFLRIFFHRHLGFALSRLHNLNQDVLSKEEEFKKRREEVDLEYAEKMKQAEQEAERIKNKTEEEVLGIKEKILEQAQIEKAGIIEQARAEKKRRESEIDAKTIQKTISLASELIEYVFSKEIKEGIHIQLVDELIEAIAGHQTEKSPVIPLHPCGHRRAQASHQSPDTSHQTPDTRHQTPDTRHQTPVTSHQTPDISLRAQASHQTPDIPLRVQASHQLINSKQVEVISVYALETKQKEGLKKILTEKIGQPPVIKEKIDKKIIGGVIIKLGDVVFDGSLRNKLQAASHKMQ